MGCICLRVPENTLTPLETCGRFSGFAQAGFNILGCCTLPGRNLDLGARVTHVSVNSRTRDNVFVTSHITVIWAVCQDGDAFRDQHHPETRQRVSINESGKRLSLVPLVGEPEVLFHSLTIKLNLFCLGAQTFN